MKLARPRLIGPREHTRYALETRLPPAMAVAALVDFSARRPQIWSETSHPRVYRVHRLGDTWAEVTEGVPHAWSREQYDWSEAGTVTLRQVAANIAVPGGSIRYRIEATAGGGSRISCDRHRTFRGLRGRVLGSLMVVFGRTILRHQLALGLERAARVYGWPAASASDGTGRPVH